MRNPQSLFIDGQAHFVIENREREVRKTVESEDRSRLLTVDVDDYVAWLVDKYTIHPIVIDRDGIYARDEDRDIDVRSAPDTLAYAVGRHGTIPGKLFSFYVPYTGERELWFLQGSRYRMRHPRAVVTDRELIISHEYTRNYDPAGVRSRFDSDLGDIEFNIAAVNELVEAFNERLPQLTQEAVDTRRAAILADEKKLDAIGIPLRRRGDAAATFSVPVSRRKHLAPPPARPRTITAPEPALSEAQYEEILKTINGITLVLERSPRTFADLGEEQLRDFLIVMLNNLYEGAVTAETFNGAGKTDILIRHDGGNIFVGECKIWKGPKKLTEAMDQLLRYVTWRDTKAALIIFDKRGNLSNILRQIPEVMTAHPNFRAERPQVGESGMRYTFRQLNDPDREVAITVLAFTVPSPASVEDGDIA